MREMAVTRTRAEEYRRLAQECFDLAREISLERDRAVVLDMAQSWLRLAEQQETLEEITPPPAVEQPQAAVQGQEGIGRRLSDLVDRVYSGSPL
jgi:DNA primase